MSEMRQNASHNGLLYRLALSLVVLIVAASCATQTNRPPDHSVSAPNFTMTSISREATATSIIASATARQRATLAAQCTNVVTATPFAPADASATSVSRPRNPVDSPALTATSIIATATQNAAATIRALLGTVPEPLPTWTPPAEYICVERTQ